jgi:VWFA-related protein
MGVSLALSAAGQATQTQAPQTPQAPIFRSGAYYVSVDAYPRKNDKIIDGLKAEDFEILEDGKPQKVESLKFFRVDPHTPDPVVRDSNTVGESLARVADPANRVFIVYLDRYHVTIAGAHDARKPLVDMLDRILAPNDLFGLVVPGMRPRDVAFGRKVMTTAEDLAKYWPWGERDSIRRSPEDEMLSSCYGMDQRGKVYVDDGGVQRWVTDVLRDRRNEDATLSSLDELITFLGEIREERKAVIVFTGGWRLFGPAPMLETLAKPAGASPIGQNGGQLTILNGLNNGSMSACNSELLRLAQLDDRMRMLEIFKHANQRNVTFYPVNPEGLVVFDTPINEAPVLTGSDPSVNTLVWETRRTQERSGNLRALASNTDGIAVVDTNDLSKGLQRVTDDLSAYYVLGYYSTNTRFDGKYRKIEVKLKPQGTRVTARRGYTAPTPAELSAKVAAAAAKADAPTVPEGFDEAMNVLAHLRPASDVFGYGVAPSGPAADLTFVTELSNGQIDTGRWAGGAKVRLVVTTAAGDPIGGGDGLIEAGQRGVALRLPLKGVAGPWRVRVTLTPTAGDPINDSFTVAPKPAALLADPLLSRSHAGDRAVVEPVASFQFRRTERLHVEWNETAPLDQRQARLLDRSGKVLPIEVTLTERQTPAGVAILAADVALSPLAPGDYLLEVTASSGATSIKKLLAIRVGS